MNELLTILTFINDHKMVWPAVITVVFVTGFITNMVCSVVKTVLCSDEKDTIDVEDDTPEIPVGTVIACSDGTFIFDNTSAATQYAQNNSDIDVFNNFVLSPEQYRALGEGRTLMLKADDFAIIIDTMKEVVPQ